VFCPGHGTFKTYFSYTKKENKKGAMLMTLGALIVAGFLVVALAAPVFNTLMSIPLVALLLLFVTFSIEGWVAGKLVRGRDFGLLGNAILGFLGTLVGGALVVLLNLWRFFDGGLISQFIVGIVGSVIFIFLMRLIDRNFAR
jgi:uncharacterized membrane protein YeaQ/YmgE (transglycosylase-associated protein family)